MAYEKTNISETSAAIPTQPLPSMREEREIDPYRKSAPLKAQAQTTKAPDGQTNINSEIKAGDEVTTPITEETVLLSPQMAALARKEQRFRREQLELKKREEALAADKIELEELKALKAKLANKDYSGIENLVKYDEYTNYLIEKDSGQSPELKAVKELKAELDGVKEAQKQDVEKRFEAAVNQRRQAIAQLVETNPEFKTLKKAPLQEAVVRHILDTWENESEELTPEQAATEVKKALFEKYQEWKSIFEEDTSSQTTVEALESSDKKQLPPLKPQVKTLTNNMVATGEIKRPTKSFQFMTDAERYAEARRRAEEKLKQQGR